MRHKRGGTKLGRVTAHRWALFRNQLTARLQHERITTTAAKAKALRPLADQLVSLSKREDLHARRQVLRLVADTAAVRKLFDTVAARYADRRGGYTRVIPIAPRRGDGAPMAILELVDRPEAPKEKEKEKKGREKPRGKQAQKEARRAQRAAAG